MTQVELENGVSSGVQFNTLGPGMVPIAEEHEARLERNISVQQWCEMDSWERALVIAVRRVGIAKQNLQADAEIKRARRDAHNQKRK